MAITIRDSGPGEASAQTAMLVEQELNEHGANSGSLSVTLRGVRPSAFIREACEAVVERHPALRTLVSASPGGLVQSERQVDECLDFSEHDLPCPEEDEQHVVRDWVASNYSSRRWRLDIEAPVKFHLLHHGAERVTLAAPVHHIAFDGRSKFVFAEDFCHYLGSLRSGAPETVTPLHGSPESVHRPTDPRLLAEALAYWRQMGLDRVHALNLPRKVATRWTRRDIQSSPEFHLLAEDVQTLRSLARTQSATLFSTLMTVIAVVLRTYGNPSAVMTVSADTSTDESADRIGRAVNVVPLVLPIDAGDTMISALAKTSEGLTHLHRFRRLPFHDVVGALSAAGEPTTALYDLGVTYVRVPETTPTVAGLDTRWDFFSPNFGSLFDITLQLRSAGGAVFGRLDHLVPSVEPALAAAFSEDIAETLRAMVASPHAPVGDLFSHPARPSTRTQPKADRTAADQLVARAAQATPDAPALAFDANVVTYGSLEYRVQRFADHVLGELRAGDTVSVHRLTAVDTLVCALGVMRAGGVAFLGSPDVGARVGVPPHACVELGAEGPCINRFENGPASTPAAIGGAWSIPAISSTSAEVVVTIPGILIGRSAAWIAGLGGSAAGRTLHRAPPSSPLYLAEAFSTLAAGGTLVLVPAMGSPWKGEIEAGEIERIYMRPHEARGLADALSGRSAPRFLREVVLAADDPWPTAAAERLLAAKVAVATQLIPADMPVPFAAGWCDQGAPGAEPPNLTHFAPGLTVEIATADGRLAPRGTAGTVRFSTATGGIGRDYGRMTLSGDVEWLGRADQATQPALAARVFELGARISTIPDVDAIHLTAGAPSALNRPVTAFVCVPSASTLDQTRVREALSHSVSLQDTLGRIVIVTNIPRSADGYVDSAALDDVARYAERPAHTADDELVKQLSDLWAWLFALPDVEPDADFYELGGHSLMAMRLLARLRMTLGLDLSPRDLMDNPSPIELAASIERSRLVGTPDVGGLASAE